MYVCMYICMYVHVCIHVRMYACDMHGLMYVMQLPQLFYVCLQICFWDPRSDDDQIQVSCLQFHNDQLLVGFKGGSLLLFQLNNQSSTITIPLHRVSILRDDPRQRGRNWQAPMELRLDAIECAPGYQPSFCLGIFPNIPIIAIGFAKENKL